MMKFIIRKIILTAVVIFIVRRSARRKNEKS